MLIGKEYQEEILSIDPHAFGDVSSKGISAAYMQSHTNRQASPKIW